MRFDSQRTHPCLVSSGCNGLDNLPDPRCADPAFAAANPLICGTGGGDDDGGGDGTGCDDPEYRATHLNECGDDPRCQDPVFAASNPTLCLNAPRLIIKPAASVKEIGDSVLFKAFLWLNGAEEELTSGVTFSSSDRSIAVIGASTGNATGLAAGVTSITATYGSLTDSAQLEVISDGECEARENYFTILLDVSKSSTGAFSGKYSNRLAMAKYLARGFSDAVRAGIDHVSLITFGTSNTDVDGFTSSALDITHLKASISGAPSTTQRTSLAAALNGAIAKFDAAGVPNNRRVVVLLTDAENNEGADPVAIAEEMRGSGTFIFAVGLRAKLSSFRLLDRIANGGFFVNALPSNEDDVLDWLTGMKGYLCSSNCGPSGDAYIGTPELNWAEFAKWTVTAGDVDLIGKNDGGVGFYDFIPGNGLVVDLCGSGEDNPDVGTLQTKNPIVLTEQEYTLTVELAGNQREEGTDVVRVRMIGDDATDITVEDIDVVYNEGFTAHEITFTPTAPQAGDCYIEIRQLSIRAGGTGVYGSLLNNVTLKDANGAIVFSDTFNDENPQYFPPCGSGYGYGDCTGCLGDPIPAQVADPSPLPDLETGDTPPTLYTSLKSCTVECEEGDGTATESAGAVSDVSQQDADNLANRLACEAATAALVCTGDVAIGSIVNFYPWELGDISVPAYTGPGIVGAAGDFWNANNWGDFLKDSNGLVTPIRISFGFPPLYAEGMFSAAPVDFDTPFMRLPAIDADDIAIVLRFIPPGDYDIYLFGHGDADIRNSMFTLETGDFQSNGVEIGFSALSEGSKPTVNGSDWSRNSFTENKEYVKFTNFNVPTGANDWGIRITIEKEADTVWWFQGFQLVRRA